MNYKFIMLTENCKMNSVTINSKIRIMLFVVESLILLIMLQLTAIVYKNVLITTNILYIRDLIILIDIFYCILIHFSFNNAFEKRNKLIYKWKILFFFFILLITFLICFLKFDQINHEREILAFIYFFHSISLICEGVDLFTTKYIGNNKTFFEDLEADSQYTKIDN